jgi:GNAT superfamily N-acetyltransferase
MERALPRPGVVEHPAPEHRAAILDLLRRHNTSDDTKPVVNPVAIVLREPNDDTIIGGLWGSSAFDWLFIDLIFVPEEFRLRGLGSTLVRSAEEIAQSRGCLGVQLNTFSFESPGFYEKLGYRTFGKLEGCPRGHQRIYFCKLLRQD